MRLSRARRPTGFGHLAGPCARAVVALILIAPATSCGGDGGGKDVIPPVIVADFAPSITPPAPNLVRLTGTTSGDEFVTLNVVVGGPTASQDLSSFSFDLRLGDPAVAELVADSATPGNALVPSAGQQVTPAAAPSPSTNSITVGVTKAPAAPGNGIAAGEAVVVTLTFRVVRERPTTIAIVDPFAAQDSAGQVVNTVLFDLQPATITGR